MSRFMAPHRPLASFRAPREIPSRNKTPIFEEGNYVVNFTKDAWIAGCASRLCELLPDADPAQMLDLAKDLWTDVSTFDPIISAEMEYESRET